MKAIILAAGFGTRLYPRTKDIPKALLELGGKTLLDHLMEKIEPLSFIQHVTLVANGHFYTKFNRWRRERLHRYRKTFHIEENGVLIPERRAGAVRDLALGLNTKQTPADDFLILCADNYFNFPFFPLVIPSLKNSELPRIGLYDIKDRAKASRYGVVMTDGDNRIVEFQEKPAEPRSTLVSLGIYYLPNKCRLRVHEYLEIEKLNPDRIGDFFAWLSGKQPVYGIEFDGQWFDIGDTESYEEAKRILDVT